MPEQRKIPTREEAIAQLYETRALFSEVLPWFLLDDLEFKFKNIFGKDTHKVIHEVTFEKYQDIYNYVAIFKYDDFTFKFKHVNGVWGASRKLYVKKTNGKWQKVTTCQDMIKLLEAEKI